MFKIGEFSKLTQVSIRMLRYYDELGLLKPARIDPFTGYRLYSTDQIPMLQRILLLRDMEFNVSEIEEALKNWDTGSMPRLLSEKKSEILESIQRQQRRIEKIEMATRDLQSNQIEVHHNVVIRQIPSYRILSLRQVIPDHFSEGPLWEKLCAFVQAEQVELASGVNNLAIYHGEEEEESGVDVEVAALVKRLGKDKDGFTYRETEAVETMACIMVYGPYENIGPAYHSFAYWLQEHRQYEMSGPSRQICHIGGDRAESPEEFLTELQTPVQMRDSFFE